MKKVLLILTIALFAIKIQAQSLQTITLQAEEQIFSTGEVETPPEFAGGMDRFYTRVGRIPYTFIDRLNECEGRVTVMMVVEKDGSLTNLKVLNGFSERQDREILRVMKRLNKWKPGIHEGKPVRVLCSIPIDFKLIKS